MSRKGPESHMKRDREAELLWGGEGIHEADKARSRSLEERDGSAGCAAKGFGAEHKETRDQLCLPGSHSSTEMPSLARVSQKRHTPGLRTTAVNSGQNRGLSNTVWMPAAPHQDPQGHAA